MAEVTVSIGEHTLRKEQQGIVLTVANKDGLLGTLTLSKGGLRWLANNQKEKGGHHFATWGQFADFMDGKPRK